MHKSQLSRLMNPAENRYLLRPYHKARIAEIFDVPESFIFGDNGQERS